MAKRAEIETDIYNDPDFLALTAPARAIYIWSFTNQRAGQSGLYKVAPSQIANETGWDGKQLDQALAELQEQRFLFYDGRVMFVRTKVKRIRTKYAETIARAIASELASVGSHPYVALWLQENRDHPWATSHVEEPAPATDRDPQVPPTWPPGAPQEGASDRNRVDPVSTGYSVAPTSPPPGPHQGGPHTDRILISSVVDVSEETPTQKDQQPGDEPKIDDRLPEDFPADAVPLLDAVMPVVVEMARTHPRCRLPSRYQVASTLMPRWRRKPVISAAHDCAGYWANRQLRDPNAAYRNWLDKCDDIAGPEPLPDAPAAMVTRLRPVRDFSRFDRAAFGESA